MKGIDQIVASEKVFLDFLGFQKFISTKIAFIFITKSILSKDFGLKQLNIAKPANIFVISSADANCKWIL